MQFLAIPVNIVAHERYESILEVILVLRAVLFPGMEEFKLEETHLYIRTKLLWVVIEDGAEQYETEILH
jgi:hypothetical protein